jgi:hypothetical protein
VTRFGKSSLAVVVTVLLATAGCTATSASAWSGEVKNDSGHLSARQKQYLTTKVEELKQQGMLLSGPMQELAGMIADRTHNESDRRAAAEALSVELNKVVKSDPEMMTLSFMTGDHPAAVYVSKESGVRIDLEEKIDHLRGQIGFFPEGPLMPIAELEGYPPSQFAVATKGQTNLRVRVPVVRDAFYLGDLIAEYKAR